MGFWSGFEGLTGHRPGAFKGFSFKDILDDDLWKRHERLGGRQSRQFEETGVVPTTAWYRGRGRPEMMGPRVGAAGVPPVDPAAIVRESPRVDKTFPPFAEQHAEIMRKRYPRISQDTLRAARPLANIQAQMLSDPLQGVGSMRIPPAELMGTQVPQVQPNRRPFQMSDMTIPPAELMGDKKTVKKIFADPNKSDEITETVTQKVPVGDMRIPTSELMGGPTVRREHSGYFPPPPNWLERTGFNPGYFGRPASIMNMRIPTSELVGGRDEDRIREMMRARRGY
jgi:hypothetical protein